MLKKEFEYCLKFVVVNIWKFWPDSLSVLRFFGAKKKEQNVENIKNKKEKKKRENNLLLYGYKIKRLCSPLSIYNLGWICLFPLFTFNKNHNI